MLGLGHTKKSEQWSPPTKKERSILPKWISLVTAQRAAFTPTLVSMASWLRNYCLHESRIGDEFCQIWRWRTEAWEIQAHPALQARGSCRIRLEFINQAPRVPLIWPKAGTHRSLSCSPRCSSASQTLITERLKILYVVLWSRWNMCGLTPVILIMRLSWSAFGKTYTSTSQKIC